MTYEEMAPYEARVWAAYKDRFEIHEKAMKDLRAELADARAQRAAMREALVEIEAQLSKPKNEHSHRESCRAIAVRALKDGGT